MPNKLQQAYLQSHLNRLLAERQRVQGQLDEVNARIRSVQAKMESNKR